jgi:hypothetical protein
LLDKLEVYRGFDVPEVWLFEEGAFTLHRLDGGTYRRVDRSTLLPDLDFALIGRLGVLADQHAALRELEQVLRVPRS